MVVRAVIDGGEEIAPQAALQHEPRSESCAKPRRDRAREDGGGDRVTNDVTYVPVQSQRCKELLPVPTKDCFS